MQFAVSLFKVFFLERVRLFNEVFFFVLLSRTSSFSIVKRHKELSRMINKLHPVYRLWCSKLF